MDFPVYVGLWLDETSERWDNAHWIVSLDNMSTKRERQARDTSQGGIMNFVAGDDDSTPNNRKNALCINCANTWWHHEGWACRNTQSNTPIRRTKFSELYAHERYMTPDMSGDYLSSSPTANLPDPQARPTAAGTPAARKQAAASLGDSEWRAWRGTPAAGHCHCGIVREQCEYHR